MFQREQANKTVYVTQPPMQQGYPPQMPMQFPVTSMGKPIFMKEKPSGEITISDDFNESIVGYQNMPSYIVYIPIQVVPQKKVDTKDKKQKNEDSDSED